MLTRAELTICKCLCAKGRSMSCDEIAESVHKDRSTIFTQLRSCEKKGCVEQVVVRGKIEYCVTSKYDSFRKAAIEELLVSYGISGSKIETCMKILELEGG